MEERDEIGRGSKRSTRRHHRSRMFGRALRSVQLSSISVGERVHQALRDFDHLAICSCRMCGNPRKFEGERTLQERRRIGAWDRDGLAPARERD